MATKNAAQQRADRKHDYDAYLAACPSRQLLERISNKWVVLVLNELGDGPARYSEIARVVAGVSQKMLTQTLRNLERDGLVHRDVEATVPVTVTYSLTELGSSLLKVMGQLKLWAEDYMPEVFAARERYDAL
ncbi:HxlR family transcriptional regulator [Arthrobacter sp. SW1]|uniref:winged helix-turn-helix transcriptional regulator n=1 Tax=Arthrobacter sp. SW1 TaxID=1920889 RepID=UPI000877CDFA|nr:helix-turn-helix domain-containing protein [Arthrobacter sp. SW1]OFI38648.1 HxlR family transcriptional regulator [Arthrobacter sp. SW1]